MEELLQKIEVFLKELRSCDGYVYVDQDELESLITEIVCKK